MADLYELVKRYFCNKNEFDDLKKLVDKDNKEIKELMLKKLNNNEATYNADDIVATVKVIETESFDDDMLVNKLRELWSAEHGSMTNPYLTMVYVPNMEAIENALYEGELKPDDLKSCKVTKSQTRLTVRRKKKNETEG